MNNNYVYINGDKTIAYYVLDSYENEVKILQQFDYASGIKCQVPIWTDNWKLADVNEIFNLK